MSTLEEFEAAPVGATATGPDGRRVIKTTGAICPWHTANGTFLYDYEIVDYVLDPLPPSTAREALDLAWELAHPVKEGQHIPSGTHYLLRHGLGYNLEVQLGDRRIDSIDAVYLRTLDPLPDQTPAWLDAPAVLARAAHWPKDDDREVFTRTSQDVLTPDHSVWRRHGCGRNYYEWEELADVTPLYPKGQDA